MTDFFAKSLDDQLAIMTDAAHKALPVWGLENARVDLIKHRENAVFKVQPASGHPVALRVHRLGYHTDAELRSELVWMQALNQSGIRTPDIIPAKDGALFHPIVPDGLNVPFQIDILSWAKGTPIGSLEEGASPGTETLVSLFRDLGQLMAKVHNQAAHWELPEGFTRHAWDIDGLTGDDPFWGRYWELDLLSDEQKDMMLKVRAKLREQLTEFGTGPDRFGLIHADFMPENILSDGEEIRVIDFDDSGFGWFMYDIATSVFFHADEPHFEAIVGALIEGYRSERELPDEHIAMLPVFMMARGVAVLGWAHTRKETQTAQELGPIVAEGICAFAQEYLGS